MNIIRKTQKKYTDILLYFVFICSHSRLWMFLFNIDIISNAEGQVIPAGDVKTIQHLEGV